MATRTTKWAKYIYVAAYLRNRLARNHLLCVSSYFTQSSIFKANSVHHRDEVYEISSMIGFSESIFFRKFHSSASRLSRYANSSQVNQSEFTEMAWEGIIGAVEEATTSKQQIVESEHLMKALIVQKDGLARRIFTKAGVDNTSVLHAIDQFISKQPKVMSDTSGPVVGPNFHSLLDNARNHKKDLGDDYVSVEHLMLAFLSDKRFGEQLFKGHQLSEQQLKDAISAVRGNQRVTDQSI